MEIENRIQWHPAFCSAIELELRENRDCLDYSREHNLSKKPLQIDLLVIKKKPKETIKNEIGSFFLGHNIMEYKAPGDELNIDTLYKVLSYACLYKAEPEGADAVPETDITVSLVREGKPAGLLKHLAEKYRVEKQGAGIYRMEGMLFPVQIIVTRELDPLSHVWLKSLTRSMKRKEAEELLEHCNRLEDAADRSNAGSVINLASDTNQPLFEQIIKGGGLMSDALKELLEPEFARLKVIIADNEAKLADNEAKLADKDAEIARLKRQIAAMQKAE